MEINLLECGVDLLKFGKVDDHEFNVDLIVFSHLLYPVPGYEKAFVCFEINNN